VCIYQHCLEHCPNTYAGPSCFCCSYVVLFIYISAPTWTSRTPSFPSCCVFHHEPLGESFGPGLGAQSDCAAVKHIVTEINHRAACLDAFRRSLIVPQQTRRMLDESYSPLRYDRAESVHCPRATLASRFSRFISRPAISFGSYPRLTQLSIPRDAAPMLDGPRPSSRNPDMNSRVLALEVAAATALTVATLPGTLWRGAQFSPQCD